MDTDSVVLSHDRGVAAFDNASGVIDSSDGVSFSWDEEHIVTVDAPSDLQGAFDTNQFYKIEDATIARPIKQPYMDDGDVKWYKKPAEELRKAAWSFDNSAYTIDHPMTGMVKDVHDVHGFWRSVRYDDDADRLQGDLYIPSNDTEALEFIEKHKDVSAGYYNRVVSEYDGDTGDLTDDDVDGFQVDMYGNHIASVERGRCSSEDGCGLDSKPTGNVVMEVSASSDAMDLSIPESAQNAAQNFLDAVDDGKVPDSCGGPDGLGRRRAQMFADGGELSKEVWATGGTSAVANWHARHEGNEDYDESEVDSPWEDCGYAMFKAWGGASARDKAMSIKSQIDESTDAKTYSDGTMVSWGNGSGEIVDSKTDGCFDERIDGDFEICASDDEPVYLIDNDGTMVAHKHETLTVESSDASTMYEGTEMMTSDLSENDRVAYHTEAIVAHNPSDEDVIMLELLDMDGNETDVTVTADPSEVQPLATTDAPSGIYVDDDGDWYGVAPTENADEEAKYDLNNCNDVKDAWNLRGRGEYDIERSTLEARIKRAGDAHDCPTEMKPWTENNTNMTDKDTDSFDIPDLSIDALEEKNDKVADLKAERDSLNSDLDAYRDKITEAIDASEHIEMEEGECICDAAKDVIEDFDEAAERVESLEDELEEYRTEEKQDALDELTDLGADRDEWEDETLSEIESEIDRREEVLESADNTSVKNIDTQTDSNDDDVDRTMKGTRKFGRGYGA